MGRTGSRKSYSADPDDYRLLEEIGLGATAIVHRAIYLPSDEVIAVKILDLDLCNSKLDDIRREAHIMSLIDHPNLVKAHCSFGVNQYLWVIMPFLAEGSCQHLMKVAYPDGLEEPAICSILYESLKALEYLHYHGHIHRDIKAGNILLHSDGSIKLGDFGVSAYMFDGGDRKHSRNTFVGTPCWMAPEVLQPDCGYDFKADIWSFGITALELAHGHAPFSKYPPMKVLLMTIQNAPPGLDYQRDKKFSRSFKEMVAMCLVKDPRKRPTAQKLLKHSFFKQAKPPQLTLKKLVADLPPLWERVKVLHLKEAAELALKKMPSSQHEAISQSEYNRGVSAWNFDIEDLKQQASLMQDDDALLETREGDEIRNSSNGNKQDTLHMKSTLELSVFTHEGAVRTENKIVSPTKNCDHTPKDPSYSGPLMLRTRSSASSSTGPLKSSSAFRDCSEDKSKVNAVEIKGRFSVTSGNIDIFKDISPISTHRSPQGSPLRKTARVDDWIQDQRQMLPKVSSGGSIPASLLSPHLQSLLHQTVIQQDVIMDLLNNLHLGEVVDAFENAKCPTNLVSHSTENGIVETVTSERGRMLLLRIKELQARMICLTEELNAEKLRYIQGLNGVPEGQEDEERSLCLD